MREAKTLASQTVPFSRQKAFLLTWQQNPKTKHQEEVGSSKKLAEIIQQSVMCVFCGFHTHLHLHWAGRESSRLLLAIKLKHNVSKLIEHLWRFPLRGFFSLLPHEPDAFVITLGGREKKNLVAYKTWIIYLENVLNSLIFVTQGRVMWGRGSLFFLYRIIGGMTWDIMTCFIHARDAASEIITAPHIIFN